MAEGKQNVRRPRFQKAFHSPLSLLSIMKSEALISCKSSTLKGS